MGFSWTCPFCGRPVTLTSNNYIIKSGYLSVDDKSRHGDINYQFIFVTCPNIACKERALTLTLNERIEEKDEKGYWTDRDGSIIDKIKLIPKGRVKPFPDYIPNELLKDYKEACLILNDSPRASATMARRCIQGIIRRFYKISKKNLQEEINALTDIVDTDLWEAIDAIRKVGNVGAHPEKDIDSIYDVSYESAKALIQLVELLFEETYIKEKTKKDRIEAAKEAANSLRNEKSEDN